MIDETPRSFGAPSWYRLLRYSALLYAVGIVIHMADHVRRGLEVLTPQVLWSGNVTGIISIVAIVLALVGYRLAPAIAVAHGFTQAIGVSAVHLLPAWGAFSDSLLTGGADPLSWIAVLTEIVCALAFGVAGALVLRRSGVAAGPSACISADHDIGRIGRSTSQKLG